MRASWAKGWEEVKGERQDGLGSCVFTSFHNKVDTFSFHYLICPTIGVGSFGERSSGQIEEMIDV